MATREKSDQRHDYLCANAFRKRDGMHSNLLHRLVGCGHEADTTCRNGLSAAKAASAPIKDKLVVAMPKPRERIQPLMPKLAKRNTTPERNNIESSAICGSAAAVDKLNSLGWLAACAALNVIPSVTGRKATEAATAKNAVH